MDLSVGSRNKVFEVPPCFRLGGESDQLREVCGRSFIQLVETFKIGQLQPGVRLRLQPMQHCIQLAPNRLLRRNEALEIDDQINCLCFIAIYCETRSALRRSLSTMENWTP